ncbi:MAG: B12-binding domain-containing protein [Oscillospiraceae bacterium]
MSLLEELSLSLQKGKTKAVKQLVQNALDEELDAKEILENGLIAGMDVIGRKFKNNEVYLPEVMLAARAMNAGVEILKPYLAQSGVRSAGKVCIGTVRATSTTSAKISLKL